MIEAVSGGLSPAAFWAAVAVTLFGGFVKGAVGFAMPMIMISAFSAFMPPPVALAGLILATVTTNVHQALRQGWRAAWDSAVAYRRMIGTVVVFIVISAQFVAVIPQALMLGLLGVPVILFAGVQLMGRSLALPIRHRTRAEYGLGAIGGLFSATLAVPAALGMWLGFRLQDRLDAARFRWWTLVLLLLTGANLLRRAVGL